MAVISNYYQDNNQQQGGQGLQNTSSPSGYNISGTQAASSGMSSGPSTQPGQGLQNQSNPEGTSSGRFTNLTNYLKANQGYNQGQGFGAQVNQGLQNKAQQVGQNISSAQTDFENKAQQGNISYDKDFVQNALQNPLQFSQNPSDVNKFNTMLTAKYAGPTSFDPNAQLKSQVGDIQNLANLAGTESGTQTLLQQLYGNPSYTSGQQNLDTLFLRSDPTQLAQVQQFNQNAQNLANQLSSAQQQENTLAGQYATQTGQTAQQTQDALKSAIENMIGSDKNSYLSQQLAAAQQKQQQDVDLYKQAASKGRFNVADLAALNDQGITAGSRLYGLNPNDIAKFITSGEQPTAQTALSQSDYAKINALKNLRGGTGIDEQLFQALGNAPQTAKPEYTLNAAGLASAIANQKQQFESQYNPLESEVGSYTQQINDLNRQLSQLPSNQTINQSMNPQLIGSVARNQASQVQNQISDLNNKIAQDRARMAALNSFYGGNISPIQLTDY